MRAAPIGHRVVTGDVYRLALPETFTGSGLRAIPEESRRVQTWGGFLCGDGHTVVAVNVTPLHLRSLKESVRARATLFRDPVQPRSIVVPGSARAESSPGGATRPPMARTTSRDSAGGCRRRGNTRTPRPLKNPCKQSGVSDPSSWRSMNCVGRRGTHSSSARRIVRVKGVSWIPACDFP